MSSIEKAIEKMRGKAEKSVSRLPNVAQHPSISNDDDTVKISETNSRSINIDLAKLRAAGFVTPDEGSGVITEQYRNIKRPILQNAFGYTGNTVSLGNLVMVTSAVPGEGKTFTSVNLALSIARERDKTVLLVDADVSKTGVSKTLGFEPGLGLSDYLSTPSMPVSNILIKTNIPKLTLISAGSKREDMTELLASDDMRNFVTDLANRYPDRIIIFDSPPLVVTSEARVLAESMGQIIMVVAAESTATHLIEESISYLNSSKAIGFILNKSRSKSVSSGYGYGYDYGA